MKFFTTDHADRTQTGRSIDESRRISEYSDRTQLPG